MKSEWTSVISRIPQGSIIGPLTFLLFVNDLPSTTKSDVMLFADDTKLWRLIRDDTDVLALQNDINRIYIQWCDKWSLKLNVEKCKHMSIAVHNEHQLCSILTKGSTCRNIPKP